MQTQKTLNEVIKDPSSFYETPKQVLEDASFTKDEKNEILDQWEQGVRALIRAEGENMSARSPEDDDAASKLQRIDEAKRVLN